MRSSSISRPPRTDELLAAALERRAPLTRRTDLTAYRLVNGAGDGLAPSATADRYGDVLFVSADATGTAADLAGDLAVRLRPRAVYARTRPRSSSRLSEAERRNLAPERPFLGERVERQVVVEHGVNYEIRPHAGLSAGLFLDMREVRRWVRGMAAGRTVLNLFAYTCGFGVVACLGGARRVLNLDASRPYLRWGQANYELNGLTPEARDFVSGDAFDWLGRLARRLERFDLVIVDPPSFGSTRTGTFSAERDYERLVGFAAEVLSRAGILLAATNHRGISGRRLDQLVGGGLDAAQRASRQLGRWHEPAVDFPVAPGARPYLKIVAHELD
jgi:23S rRNA (cytosine1962-C5)-methyltransferase